MPNQTFEVFLRHSDGHRQFILLTAARPELLRRVGALIAEHGAVSAEVHEAGEYLFDVGLDDAGIDPA